MDAVLKLDDQMTAEQRALVEHNLDVADRAMWDYAHLPRVSPGLDREDLLQIGYLALCKAAVLYDGDRAQFRTYAEAAARNAMKDCCRQTARSRTLSLDAMEELERGGQSDLYDILMDEGMARELARIEVQDMVERCRRQMSGRAAKGFHVLHLQLMGWETDQIARHLGAQENCVRSWASRARKHIRAAAYAATY